jgi:hypothetical protein
LTLTPTGEGKLKQRLARFGTEFTVWYRVPPSPFSLQNLENNRLRFSTMR